MKLFFLDIDGTLVSSGREPSQTAKKNIEMLRRQGDKVFLCTGRAVGFLPDGVRMEDFDGGIFSAGGLVIAGGQELYRSFFPVSKLERIFSLLEQLDAIYIMESDHMAFRSRIDLQVFADLKISDGKKYSELEKMFSLDEKLYPIEKYNQEPVYKIVIILRSKESVDRLSISKPSDTDIVYMNHDFVQYSIYYGEMSDACNTKGNGMLRVCEHFGVSPKDCVAFGDSMNDASILKLAGEGIAMGNAEQEVKDLADRVCGRCLEDGLAEALKEYIRE